MAFQLPPAGAAPPNFNGGSYSTQTPMQPQQPLLQSTNGVGAMAPQPQQQPTAGGNWLSQAQQSYPSPNLSGYFNRTNTGSPQMSPQVNGLAQRVQPISLQGSTPQFRRFALGVN